MIFFDFTSFLLFFSMNNIPLAAAHIFNMEPVTFLDTGLPGFLSAHAVQVHVKKHHQAYIDTANKLIQGSGLEEKPIEEIIQKAQGPLFNNVAQHYNHRFFWRCLSADKVEVPKSVESFLEREFGSFDNFKKLFTDKASTLFGSGWVYLYRTKEGKYEIQQYQNALNPVKDHGTPILCVDTWEHSWYIDYENVKAQYFANFWDHINWNYVAENIKNAESISPEAAKRMSL